MKRRRGILLIDLMVAMAIIGVVLLAVMPTIRSDGPLQLVAGSTMLSADIEYAQSRTLAEPGDPVAVVFEADGTGYWLSRVSEPLVPINDPDGEAWHRVFGEGVVKQLDGCTLERYELPSLADGGPEVIIFDAFGRLENDTDVAISIVNASGNQAVHVRAATGSVSILSEVPEDLLPMPEPEPDPAPAKGGDDGKGDGLLGGLGRQLGL